MKYVKLESKTLLMEILNEPLLKIDKIKDLFVNLIDPEHCATGSRLNSRRRSRIPPCVNKPDVGIINY